MVVTFRSSFEGFFASKGAAYALPDGDFARRATKHGGMWICSSDYSCFWSLFRKKLKLFPSSLYSLMVCHVTCSALNLFQERCNCICRPWSICYGMKMCLDSWESLFCPCTMYLNKVMSYLPIIVKYLHVKPASQLVCYWNAGILVPSFRFFP